jgi:hypothetical protein
LGIRIGILGASLGWVLVSLFFASEPILSMAWVQEFGIALGVLVPWFLVLGLAICLTLRKHKRLRVASSSSDIDPLGPGLLILVGATWFVVLVVLASYVMINPFATILMVLFPTLGLVCCWLGLTGRAAYRAWKGPNIATIAKTVGYLVPFPLLATALLVLTIDGVPLRVRFEISEPAMYDRLDEFERSGKQEEYDSDLVGLYKVDAVYHHAGCVVLQTMRGIDETGGFAYCPGSAPTDPELEHLKDRWWVYRSWH